jgi:hypothetical protein
MEEMDNDRSTGPTTCERSRERRARMEAERARIVDWATRNNNVSLLSIVITTSDRAQDIENLFNGLAIAKVSN